MARFDMELPTETLKDLERIYGSCEKIFGDMTQAGAEVAEKNILANMPKGIRESKMLQCLKVTKTYKTPSDDGINTKVGFYGYFENEDGRLTPAPLVANIFEYGRSNGTPFPKHPFMRKSFKKSDIEQAMLKVQKQESGGLLDE